MKSMNCPNKGKCCSECNLDDAYIEEIASVIRSGDLMVYPTDTLYGLGADPFNDNAVKKVFIAKNRPFDMPLSIAVSDSRMLESIAVMNDSARKLIDRFLPGPLTVLLTKKPSISDLLTSGENQIGIRIPDHPFALRFIRMVGPITSTSANLHASPNPVDVKKPMKEFGEIINYYVDCGKTKCAAPSTIVDISEGEVEIVRPGIITKEEIDNALTGR